MGAVGWLTFPETAKHPFDTEPWFLVHSLSPSPMAPLFIAIMSPLPLQVVVVEVVFLFRALATELIGAMAGATWRGVLLVIQKYEIHFFRWLQRGLAAWSVVLSAETWMAWWVRLPLSSPLLS